MHFIVKPEAFCEHYHVLEM